MPIELSTDLLQEPVASCGTVMACLRRLNSENGAASVESDQTSRDVDSKTLVLSRVVELAAGFGFTAERSELDWAGLKATGFTDPILALRKDNDAVIVTGGGRAGTEEVSVWDPHHDGVVFFVPREDFERHWNGHALVMTRAQDFATGGDHTRGAAGSSAEQAPPCLEDVTGALPSHLQSGKHRLSPRWSLSLVAVASAALGGLRRLLGRQS